MSDLPPPPGYQPPADLPPPPGAQGPGAGPFQGEYGPTGAPGYGQAYGGAPPPVLAGFWRRFAAWLIDGVVVGVPVLIVALLLGDDTASFSTGGYSPFAELWVNAISLAVGVAYYATLEGGPKGQTVGKMVMSIRVVDTTTMQPGIGGGRGVGRYFARILSSLPLYLGYFWMLWDRGNQTWHDKLVRTYVVRSD